MAVISFNLFAFTTYFEIFVSLISTVDLMNMQFCFFLTGRIRCKTAVPTGYQKVTGHNLMFCQPY
jgi:hypothetical protein